MGEKTLEQIKTCDVGSFFNERYPDFARDEYEGLKIPTLEEVFQRYGTETNDDIETRSAEAPPGNPGVDASSGMEEELMRLLDEYGLSEPAAGSWRVLIQSFVPASLEEIHAETPRCRWCSSTRTRRRARPLGRTSRRPGATRSG